MNLKTTILLVLFAIGVTSAQKKWTLEECVTYAVDNNITIAQYELDLENVKIDHSDAIGNMLPDLNVQMRTSGNTGLVLDPTTNNLLSATIFSASSDLTSSLTLFDGLRNINRLHRAKLNAIANQYRLDDLVDDIRLAVANAYLQILSNKESLKVFRAQYAITEQDLRRTRELVESGVVARGDLLEIEATAANQEQQIVNAENMVLISRINLAQLLQITDFENFYIADEEFDVPPYDILNNSARTIYEKAVTFRNDIKF
jgi:outer membrane protein